MKTYVNFLILLFLILATPLMTHPVNAQDLENWEETDAILVGRISHVEGQLSRYDPEADAWISTTREAPFGIDDLLRTDAGARAEIILPNNTWARIDGDTRIQLTALSHDLTEVDFAHGNARLYNKSSTSEINATTPFGRITASPGAVFDLYVSESGVDITAIRKSVYFHHNASDQRHDVRADSSTLFADMQSVSAVTGDSDPDWAAWNRNMDDLWAGRMETRGESATYLPSALHSEAHALDKHGHWERVYYEGRHYRFWRPVQVSAHWSPFSWGAWIVWHGDHVWVPHEPFGYVTHHYGNWIFTAGHWYWAPPVTRVTIRARLPLLRIGFGWYPGRVSWIHSGAHIGWIPLGPHEPYYTHRRWGRRSIVVTGRARYHTPSHHHRYRNRHHAVVIHRSHLYRSKNYRHARVRDVSHDTIRKKFRPARLLHRKIVKDHRRLEKRDRFHNKQKRLKPRLARERQNRHDKYRRSYARQADKKRHLRRDRHRSIQKNDQRTKAKHRLRKQGDSHPGKGIDRTLKQRHRTEKKKRVEAAPGSGVKPGYRSGRNHRDRPTQNKSGIGRKERQAEDKRLRERRKIKSRTDRRFVKNNGRKPSTDRSSSADIRPSRKNRSHDRRPTEMVKRPNRSGANNSVKADRGHRKERKEVSRRQQRKRNLNEVNRQRPQPRVQKRSERDSQRKLRQRSNRGTDKYKAARGRRSVNTTPEVRQPSQTVRRPAAKHTAKKRYSPQQRRPKGSDQRWQSSTGRRSGGRETPDRNRTRRGRQYRN